MTHNDLRQAFREMFGFEPYDFQIEVAYQLLGERKNVILQAPTGSGKTWTALFPFLFAWLIGSGFPRKCLYAVPLRVLTEQFKDMAEKIISTWSGVSQPAIRIQTGEYQSDRTFEGDLIFTTIDQVISSALSIPYSLSKRQANINAGAVFSSFLVCDELHLFPIDERTAQGALATLIELLHFFGETIPFLLMTATLSDQMLQLLERELHVVVVRVSADELGQIESQQKVRRYVSVEGSLTAQAILQDNQTRSIAICNQVPRAISLYDDLCAAVDADLVRKKTTCVMLLHSRFIKRHRRGKEQIIRRQFKQVVGDQPPPLRVRDLILVATQTIEVGLDITCERLHTELAPANAIIQRAGRCARYKGEEGAVLIYLHPTASSPQLEQEQEESRSELSPTRTGGDTAREAMNSAASLERTGNRYLPYSQDLCEATWQAFSLERYNGQALSFLDEQAIVSLVHDPVDRQLFTRVLKESYGRWEDITAALFRGDKQGRSRLIRKVDSRTILVHDDPAQILIPYRWRGFSLYHGTLRGWVHDLREAGRLSRGMIQYPIEIERDSTTEPGDPLRDVQDPVKYRWESVRHEGMVDDSSLFVVHPRLISYDREHGFQLKPSARSMNIVLLEQEPQESSTHAFETCYALESYTEHIRKMLSVYRGHPTLSSQISFAAQRLASLPRYKLHARFLERAVLLAIALHDVGKLQVEWQRWSHAYQQEIGEAQEEDAMIVHTHYRPGQIARHREAEQALKNLKRPPHAAEGAWASWAILLEALEQDEWLAQAVFTAIARHHSSFSTTILSYTLHSAAPSAIREALELIQVPGSLATHIVMQASQFPKDGALDDYLLVNGDARQWLVYALIVRALRLCDGKSLEVL